MIGNSASSITTPVSSTSARFRNARDHHGLSRFALKARIVAEPCSATIASTAPKLSWKLGPTTASGHSSITPNPATARSRNESGSRPSATAASTSSAPRTERTVGTSAPVSSV